jgi:hypothetical protein
MAKKGMNARKYTGKKIVKLMEHEAMRWGYMTEEAMIHRIRKITRLEKLACTIKLANAYNRKIYKIALARRRELLAV